MNYHIAFYVQPIMKSIAEIVLVYSVWTSLTCILSSKLRKILSGCVLIISLGLIIYLTILNRTSSEREISLIPFSSLVFAQTEPEFYRTLLMNAILFIPLGLSLPFFLPNRVNRKVLFLIAFAASLSVSVETIQFAFKLGRCETDDVIMNTLGAFIGATSYWFHKLILTAVAKCKEAVEKRRKHD